MEDEHIMKRKEEIEENIMFLKKRGRKEDWETIDALEWTID